MDSPAWKINVMFSVHLFFLSKCIVTPSVLLNIQLQPKAYKTLTFVSYYTYAYAIIPSITSGLHLHPDILIYRNS